MGQIGALIMFFITILVGVVLLAPAAQQVGEVTNTIAVSNESLGTAAATGTTIFLTQYRAIDGVTVWNATGDVAVPADNYTIINNVVDPTTGGASVNFSFTTITGVYAGVWTFDATAQPTTYVTDSGARAVSTLIIIMFALAILAIAVGFAFGKEKMKEMMGI